jgi:diguanylate cyclase (GGDEF)-like protein
MNPIAKLAAPQQIHFSADTDPESLELEAAVTLANSGYPCRAHMAALALLERARAAGNTRLIAGATSCLAGTSRMIGLREDGIRFAREARTLFDQMGDLAHAAGAGDNLAWLLASIGEQDAIVEALAALDRAERSGDPNQTILALDTNAIVLWLLRQLDQALPFAERAEELSRLHQPRLKRPLINLAGIRVELALKEAKRQEDRQSPVFLTVIQDAIALTREALALARCDGDGWLERLALCNIAEYSLHIGDTTTAQEALEGFHHAAGEPTDRCRAVYLHMLGCTRAAQNRLDEAIAALVECQETTLRSTDLEVAIPCHQALSDIHARRGDYVQALDAYRSFHDLYVRQASHAAQRRARLYTLEWEAERLRASVRAALDQAAELTATNRVLARETERLLRASMEDPLTGLPNRRRLDLAFVEQLAGGQPYAIAMIDVDTFKQVNDRFTHPVGDATLREVAALLLQGARSHDLVVRFGGDEFALLLRGADLETSTTNCARLCAQVRGHDWSRLHPDLRVTLSIGVAASHEAPARDAVFALADRRLYAAKQTGRDKVVAA